MKIIDFNDKIFPYRLKNINNPPKKLYIEGNIDILNDYSIAVIGSRDCSSYGRKWCDKFVKGLLEYGLVIVSGMARGIDSCAHNATLKYGCKTIAVLPSGFNNVYPEENFSLYKEIIDSGGAVITEYPPYVKANSKRFLERNRIVSGLAIGTLVVEAEHRSGTSVTARITKSQGKEVFCIPGSLDNGKSMGTNKLIQNGAKIATCVEDIVVNYNFLEKVKVISEVNFNKVNEDYQDIFNLFVDSPLDIDELIKLSKLNINELMSKITMMELDGLIKRLPGNKFIKV